MQRNNIHSHIIQIGQKIKIPGTGLDINDAKKWSIYTVQDGDSLWQIAKQNKVSIKDIPKWNDLNLNLPLQIGKKIELHIKQNLRTD
jgi:LysM repeat protein